MSAVIVVSSQIDLPTLAFLKKQLAGQLTGIVSSALGGTVPVIYRPAIAQDFNVNGTPTLTNARLSTSSLTAATVNASVFKTALPNNKAIGIYGYAALSAIPNIDAIIFSIGGAKTLAQIQLTEIYANQETVGYFDPIIFYPNQTIQIGLLSHDGVTTAEEFDLLAYVAEPVGLTLAPNDIS